MSLWNRAIFYRVWVQTIVYEQNFKKKIAFYEVLNLVFGYGYEINKFRV